LTSSTFEPHSFLMRVVLLSDHPDDMLTEAVSERQHRADDQEAALTAAVQDRDGARAQRRWWTWLRLTFRARRERKELTRLRAFSQVPTNKESAIRAGRDAERQVEADLEHALDGEWTLFRGYRNRRGEIDGLLLGPGGLFAYEVKYLNGTIYISGDEWLSERFDRYGNLVKPRAPLRDRGGRSPSRQLNDPANALGEWLGQRGQRVTITPVVLLVHERSRIGAIRNPTAEVATSVDGLLRLTGESAVKLAAGRRAAIEKIIRDDHRHYAQRARRAR
jgi:hypothetical protein